MFRTITRAAVLALAIGAAAQIAPAAASASTGPAVHYVANDTTGHRYGPAITGNAVQAITSLGAVYAEDPAELANVASFAHYQLPGGVRWLIAHPQQRAAAAQGFGKYLLASVREEVKWTSPYETEYAVPHGSRPTTFGWTRMGNLTRDVLVFYGHGHEFDLAMNCGGQPYIPGRPIPLPSRPRPVTCKAGNTGNGKTCTTPCPGSERLFSVPGYGQFCLCLKSTLILPPTVEVITKITIVQIYQQCPSGKKQQDCALAA